MRCLYPVEGYVGKKDKRWTTRPCGQCVNCRINRRQSWVLRNLLESREHAYMHFVTLTYDDDHLPVAGRLDKPALQKFYKRLRNDGFDFRYFGCGEYGTKTHRPHYHVCLYTDDFIEQDDIEAQWPYGHVHFVTAITDKDKIALARYTAGYCLKKLSGSSDAWAKFNVDDNGIPLDKNTRDFMSCSKRPPLGATPSIIADIGDALQRHQITSGASKVRAALSCGTHKGLLRFGGKNYPMDDLLKDRLIAHMGLELYEDVQAQTELHNRLVDNVLDDTSYELDLASKEAASEFAASMTNKIKFWESQHSL